MLVSDKKIIRRCTRLLAAVLELHKQGYQHLAIYTELSGCEKYWQLRLLNIDDLYLDDNNQTRFLWSNGSESAVHSSGETGNQYFGWDDAQNLNARQLAEQIKSRFPKLVSSCKGQNFPFSGWLTYIVGKAEQGSLPLMNKVANGYKISGIGSTTKQTLIAPSLKKLQTINGRKFFYVDSTRLYREIEWNFRFIHIINDFRRDDVARFPEFPVKSDDVTDHASYWEGAVYYIQEVFGFNRIDDYLEAHSNHSATSERWSSFLAIWDNADQLAFLNAHLLREMFNNPHKYPLSESEREKWQRHLVSFERQYEPKSIQKTYNHNPYFGGDNPMHLGPILGMDGKKETLLKC